MRDLLFLVIFPFLVYASFKRPFIGAAMWLWVAMHFPNGWVYGMASSFRYNFIIVICAFISYIFWREKQKIAHDKLNVWLGFFLFWTLLSTIFTIAIPELVWGEWIEFLKISLLYFFCIAVLYKKLHIHVMLWALVFSIGFYGCLEGLKYIASGGGHRIHGLAGHVLGDRNELALSFNMMLPLLVYLSSVTKNKFVKLGLKISICLLVIAIIGTFSRGGLLALLVVAGFFWLQSKRKITYAVLLVLVVSIGTQYLPSEWHNRMDTIENAAQDSSFLGRVVAWKTAVVMANNNPILGAGFKAGQVSYVWDTYAGYLFFNDVIDTSELGHMTYKAAHSIYFQVLGDHGYVGLLIFLTLLSIAFFKALRVARLIKKHNLDPELGYLCRLISVSIIAYCAGGAAVSLAYFDMLYALFAIIYVIEHRIVNVAIAEQAPLSRSAKYA